MNKQKLVDHICAQLVQDLTALIQAAQATYEAATHEESKPENEYDTRGLEASYLAGAQAKRVAEIEETIMSYKQTPLKNFEANEPISATALVQIQLNGKKNSYVFIMPKGGGQITHFEGHSILVITPNSPLGEALLGLKVNDYASVETGSQLREYQVLSVQ